MSNTNSSFQKPTMQLLLIAMLCVASATIFSLIASVVVMLFFGFDLQSFGDYSNPSVVEGLKFFQLLSAIGVFIVPPILFGWIVYKKPISSLSLKNSSTPINWFMVFVVMVVSMPFLSWLVEFNQQLVLPEFLATIEQWMKQSEQNAEAITKLFLTFNGITSFLYVLLIVAVVPAIGEELLFRGVVQKIMVSWAKNYHVAIWITAILFSALHMQFYGFFPRMLLGAMFGYVFYWSNSLWLPILGHFINNGSVVFLTYLYPEMMENTEINLFDSELNWIASIVSAFLLVVTLAWFKKLNNKQSSLDKLVQ